MDISDYRRILDLQDALEEAGAPIKKRAIEIAATIARKATSDFVDVAFQDDVVIVAFYSHHSEDYDKDVRVPVKWLFDPNWESEWKSIEEEKRRRLDERIAREAENDRKRAEEKERKEYERLRTKFEGAKP